ncbi:MAG: Threonine-tRNA ligase [Candidatus Roizmanbacteria bacterium GW2011_GWA2_33_33]|uniref:Threonine--tRNA ligase n=2 Tax=Candidatus Roizmaniibacteriota TaxID=1752723 RepID=A0A0G0DE29_9BACT|nr:MAG: Threonine-tRNA ligase [Candidatus Roizmanbacteria bacterium GW2011_GWA2_33_33]KKP61525.1 MAG: Threonine-tRNA ligase [Candidatus Roizmanbacteria bacterium GW2011_GWC2_34_23]
MEKNNLDNLRHSCAHLLAHAVKQLYPGALNAIGPAIENGFYQDFDLGKWSISEEDFPKIEAKMRTILPTWQKFSFKEVTLEEAKKLFKDNKYKVEMATEFAKQGKKLQTNDPGDFLDLCKMGHVENPAKELLHFKLLSVAGAYWRGDEKNKMLTRIYGTVFPTKEELENHLKMLEEAKKRDHRKLGKELDLFVISENIGKGLPLITPKGNIIRKQILDYEYELEKKSGFQQVFTPHIARSEMYKKTGHWQHYRDVMYAPFGIDGEEYVLKPMNCPHHYMIYAARPRSYKDLPMRLSEPGTCYRFEKTGELAGLLRVRALSIDDSHILMRESQIESEFKLCIEMVKKMFKAFSLNNFYVRLSLVDPSDAVKYIADAATWKKAGEKLEKIVKDNKLKYIIAKGEASFYGPKIDFMVKDSLGREWQMSTLQLDLFMGKKLNLTYINEEGKEEHPVILHRGLTGSLERTMAILIEHFAGAFPLWLSPVQVIVLPISEKFLEPAQKIKEELAKNNIRVELNADNKSLGGKIRESTLQKIPYMVIIGEKELKSNSISVRKREGKDLGSIEINKFINQLKSQIENFS